MKRYPRRERRADPTHFNTTHGWSQTRIYDVWRQMIQRCHNPAHKDYPAWGGRGIAVCQAWHDINTFVAWAALSGYGEGLTIERKDNDVGYQPSNCQWIPNGLQAKNTRRRRWLEIDGEVVSLDDACAKYGIKYRTLVMRLNLGWSHKDAVTIPVKLGRNQGWCQRETP